MARKVVTVTIPQEGRDKGKAFLLTEMSASQAEKWALRALLALSRAGFEIPDGAAGMAGIAQVGFQAFGRVDFHDAEPLLDEMFTCLKCVPDPNKPEITRPLVDDDIEEVQTRIYLRGEIFRLHVDFSKLAGQST